MTPILKIGQDEAEITYFAVGYEMGCLSALPWDLEQFDCLILKNDNIYEKR